MNEKQTFFCVNMINDLIIRNNNGAELIMKLKTKGDSRFANIAVSNEMIPIRLITSGGTYNGLFLLTIQKCTGTLLHVLHTNDFRLPVRVSKIKDALTQDVVMSVTFNSGQMDNNNWTTNVNSST